jgi:hypothetical protein
VTKEKSESDARIELNSPSTQFRQICQLKSFGQKRQPGIIKKANILGLPFAGTNSGVVHL